jgi:hypothetical protein
MKAGAILVWAYRWVGLAIAGFPVVVGLTGSLLAFNVEFERFFAPQLFARSPPPPSNGSISRAWPSAPKRCCRRRRSMRSIIPSPICEIASKQDPSNIDHNPMKVC